MTRNKRPYKLMAASTVLAVITTGISMPANANYFSDIQNSPYADSINKLYEQGIINGYGDSTYKPNKILKRSDVVKILGKYMVTLGYQVPQNYLSMRFNDLHSLMDDELLQYAALVYDQGVFIGSAGNLNPSDPITHEQMALVLVRALSAIHDFDYVSHVQGQTFFQEYMDLEQATPEAQAAINVFDFYDVTFEDYYYPKKQATRGIFAHYLSNMLQIQSPTRNDERPTLERVMAISNNRLLVTLSNGMSEQIQLEETLKENTPTTVTFMVQGQRFTETVEYVVGKLEIVNVKNINAGQFVLEFNQPVSLSTYQHEDLEKIFKLTRVNGNNSEEVVLKKGELSKDGRSYTIKPATYNPLEGRYRLQIKGLHSENGLSLPDYEDVFYFGNDSTAPEIAGVEYLGDNKVKILFSEPVSDSERYDRRYDGEWYYPYYDVHFETKYTEEKVTGVKAYYEIAPTERIFDFSDALADGDDLEEGTKVTITFENLRDMAGNRSVPSPLTVDIVVGEQDQVSPHLERIEEVGAKQFKLIFTEELSGLRSYDIEIFSNTKDYKIADIKQDKENDQAYIVTVDDYLYGDITVRTAKGRYIKDKSGESGSFTVTHAFDHNLEAPRVMKTSVIRENNLEYLYIEFDRRVTFNGKPTASVEGTYTVNRRKNVISGEETRVHEVKGEPTAVRIPLRELLGDYDVEDATYDVTISFENVKNEFNVRVPDSKISFTRYKDYYVNKDELKVVAVNTSRTDRNILSSKKVVIDFNYRVNATYATQLKYYDIEGYKIKKAEVNPYNAQQVILTLETELYDHDEPYILIEGLRAEGSIEEMDHYYEKLYLAESESPTYYSADLYFEDEDEIVLKFSEAIRNVDERAFIVKDEFDDIYTSRAVIDPNDSSKVILYLDEDLPSNVTITVQLKPNREITDRYNNKGIFKEILEGVYRP